MPTARYYATAVGYHSMLIVVGGTIMGEHKWTIAVLSTTELLDTTNGCWYTCNNLPLPRQLMRAAIMNDKLYLSGGFDKNSHPSPEVFVASLDTLSIHQLNWQSALNTPRGSSAPVVLYKKFLLTVGEGKNDDGVTSVGEGKNDDGVTSEVCFFNPSTGQQKYLTNIPSAVVYPAVVGVGNNILVIGGDTNNIVYSNKVWIGMFE